MTVLYYLYITQMSLESMTALFPSTHVTVVPLRPLSTETTLREELLVSPFSSVRDDMNLSPGPHFSVTVGLF